MNKKVYILDYDLISPLGLGKDAVFTSLKNNLPAENQIKRFDTSGIPFNVAAEIPYGLDFLYRHEDPPIRSVIQYDRKFELTVSVFNFMRERLIALSGLAGTGNKGVIFGMGADVTPFELIDKQLISHMDSGNPYIETILEMNSRNGRPNVLFNPYDISAIYLSEKMQAGAFQKTSLTACAASTQAIGLAYQAILNGEADWVAAGGSDSILNAMAYASFLKLGVLSVDSSGGRTCRPFDLSRSGTLAGESAGICVLANEDFVKRNHIRPLFEFLSWGNTLDAYQITSPDPEGKGMARAMHQAVKNAGIHPADIGYINLHGTGTHLNDPLEIKALKKVFGEALKNIPVSSTKDRHGHAIAAAGIQELSVLCLCLENDFIPCNMNLEKPLETEGIDLVMHENRSADMHIGMTCNYSFGGVNTVLIIKKLV